MAPPATCVRFFTGEWCLSPNASAFHVALHQEGLCFTEYGPKLSNLRLAPPHPCLPTAIGNRALPDGQQSRCWRRCYINAGSSYSSQHFQHNGSAFDEAGFRRAFSTNLPQSRHRLFSFSCPHIESLLPLTVKTASIQLVMYARRATHATGRLPFTLSDAP